MAPAPVPVPARSEIAVKRARVTLAGIGFFIYLWVIHSGKAPIGAAAIAVGLAGVFLQPQRLRIAPPLLWFGAVVAWGGVGYFASEFPDITSDAIVDYFKLWLICLLAMNVAHTRSQLRWMMIAWMGIFALYPARGILFNFISGISIQGRYAWNFIFSNPNDFATLTLPLLAMSVALLQAEKERWVRICALAGVVVLPIVMMLTQSRGGILALFTFGALVLIQYRKRVGAIILAVLVMAAVAQLAPAAVWGRLASLQKLANEETINEADNVGSAQQRYDIWGVARGVIADHPVTGSGLGTYTEIHGRYAATGRFPGFVSGKRDAHSTYFRTTAETGFPGLALFVGLILATFHFGFRGASRIKQTDPAIALSIRTLLFGLIAFMQACIFASMEFLPFLYLYIALICTMVAVNERTTLTGAPVRAPGPRRS